MAYPQVVAVDGGYRYTNSTSHTVNLPADIQAGDLLLVFFCVDADPIVTFPEGWTELFHASHEDYHVFGTWYRIADGEEGATITVTTSSSQMSAHTSYRITGHSGTPEAGTAVTTWSFIPNPPSLTPTWGAKDTLWFASQGNDKEAVNVTDYPADYTDGRNDRGSASGGVGVATARRELNAVSEDPGTFTLDTSCAWVANTVAVQPEEAPPVAKAYGLVV